MLSAAAKRWVRFAVHAHKYGSLPLQQIVVTFRDALSDENRTEMLDALPPELAKAVRESLRRSPPLKAIGYWYNPHGSEVGHEERYPDPKRLVGRPPLAADRRRVAAYLRSGWTYAAWRGVSFCRFRCGEARMGSKCLSDGEWVWPEGLAHYVEKHRLRLPDEFLATMKRNGWWVPADPNGPTHDTHGKPDDTFWVAWGRAAAGPS